MPPISAPVKGSSVLHQLLLSFCLVGLPAKIHAQAQDFQSVLDNTSLTFAASSGIWGTSLSQTADGEDALYAAYNSSAPVELSTSTTGPGHLVFWATKPAGTAAISLLIDGVVVYQLPPNDGAWRQYTVPVPAGNHAVSWRVAAGISGAGLDRVQMVSSASQTLEQTLPPATWTTGGSVAWTANLFPATWYRGRASVSLPYSATVSQVSWLEAPFNGPGRLTWKCSGGTRILINGIPQQEQTTDGAAACMLPPGLHTVRWQRERTAGAGNSGTPFEAWLENPVFTSGTALPLEAALSSPIAGSAPLTFTTGGASPFDAVAMPGSDPVTSGNLTHSGILPPVGNSWLETAITGPGVLSSNGTANGLNVEILLDGIVASQNWNPHPGIQIPPGQHTIRWQARRNEFPFPTGTSPRARLQTVIYTPAQELSPGLALEAPASISFYTANPEKVYGTTTSLSPDGDAVFINGGFVLTATLTGPARLAWTGMGSQSHTLDGLPIHISAANGNLIPFDRYLDIPAGSHTVAWTPPAGATTHLDTLTLTPYAEIPPANALGGGAVWEISPEVTGWEQDGGVAALLLPAPGTESRPYGLSTTVTGPGIFTLRYQQLHSGSKIAFRMNGTDLQLPHDYPLQPEWTAASLPLPAGTHTLTISAAPGTAPQTALPAYALFQEISWLQQQPVSLAEALDHSSLTWTSGGSVPWAGVATPGGNDAARVTGLPSTGSSAWLETTATGPGLLSFIPGGTADYEMTLLINGAAQVVSNVQPFTTELPAGAVTLRWQVSRTSGGSSPHESFATLDAVEWHPYAPQPVSEWSPASGFTFTSSPHQWATVASPDADGGGSLHPLATVQGGTAWIETTASGPAVLEFSLYHPPGSSNSYPNVSLDNGARFLNTVGEVASGWTDHRLFLPDGPHTIRWIVDGHPAPVFIDRLRLLPASQDLAEGADLPDAGWTSYYGPEWFTVFDSSLPDGDVLTCEHGFHFGPYPVSLAFPVQGPARYRLHSRSAGTLTFLPFPSSATALAGGWYRHTIEVPPGSFQQELSAQGTAPPVLDQVTREALPALPLAGLFPLPGAVWETNPLNPGTGFAGQDGINAIFASAAEPQPAAWAEVTLTGPGKLRFSADAIIGHPLAFPWLSEPSEITISVNSIPLPGLTGYDNKIYAGFDAPAMDIHLPAGPQTIRWTLPPGSGGQTATLKLHTLTFTPGPVLFSPSSISSPGAFLARTSVTTQNGPVLNISYSGNESLLPENASLTWTNPEPGILRFLWRRPPGVTWPPSETAHFDTLAVTPPPPPALPWTADYAPRYQTSAPQDGTWQAVEILLPYPQQSCSWRLPSSIPSVEVTALTFTPATSITLTEALNLPGITVTTDPLHPWTGLRLAGGRTLICPSLAWLWPFSGTGWMEAVITGPAEIRWSHQAWADTFRGTARVFRDGIEAGPDTLWQAPDALEKPQAFVVPPGTHTIRWQRDPGDETDFAALHSFTVTPLPSAWFTWNPFFQPEPIIYWPPASVDYDRDGADNLLEFTFGTNIIEPQPPVSLEQSIEAGHLCITMPAHRPLSDGVRVTLETSADMQTWAPAAAELVTPAPPGRVKYRFTAPHSAAAGRTFVRATVSVHNP